MPAATQRQELRRRASSWRSIIRDDPATTSCLLNRAYSYGTERKPTPQEQAGSTSLQSQLSKRASGGAS